MSVRRAVLRLGYGLLALSAAALATPTVGVGHANAASAPYSGFSTLAVSTPLELDVYEPTIPLPASPQLEMELGYAKALADSSGSRGRASLVWPGDVIGEGLKTIVDASGLPKQLGENGYPVQANASYPGGPAKDEQQPLPGAVMRTSATAAGARSQAGWSGDCDVANQDPSTPAGATSCAFPGDLRRVADIAGASSSASVVNDGKKVIATAQASAGEASLIGGLITVSGLSSKAVSTSDGHQTKGVAAAAYASVSLAGQVVRIGPDGAAVAGQTVAIPGLPADPNDALTELGIRLTVPKPLYERRGSLLTSSMAALVVDVDTGVLRHKLDPLPWSTIGDAINQLPDQLQQVKNVLGAALYLSPRFVITLAKSQSAVNTVQGIALPPLPDLGGITPPTPTVPSPGSSIPGTLPGVTSPSGPDTLGSAGPVLAAGAAGLPKGYTLPGVLLLGAVAASAALGTWLRRAAAVLLGGSASCPHGLGTGLPDLRRAMT